MKKFLVISDDLPIGGHEVMCSRIVNTLAAQSEHRFVVAGNEKFLKLFGLQIQKIEFHLPTRFANGSLGLIFVNDYFKILQLLKKIKPDAVILSQGTIEYGAKVLVLGRMLRLPVFSYIPLVIDLKVTGSRWFPRIRNLTNRWLYKLPDRFVTIGDVASKSIDSICARRARPTLVVKNWVELPKQTESNLDVDVIRWIDDQQRIGRFVIAIVGRVEFRHKQQDKFLEYFIKSDLKEKCSILFAGGGSDEEKLRCMLKSDPSLKYFGPIIVNNVKNIFSKINLLVVCSSFEGVPLVVLEALSCGTNVVSFRYDSIIDYLGQESLVANGDFEELGGRIEEFLTGNASANTKEEAYCSADQAGLLRLNDMLLRDVSDRRES